VSIVRGCDWIGRPGFDSRQVQELLSLPPRPDRLWSPLSLLSNE